MAQPNHQLDLDFLPARYREQHRHRRLNLWRIVVVTTATALLVVGAGHQWSVRWNLQWELAAAKQRFESQRALAEQLGQLQTDLNQAEAKAQLLAFLEHRWPLTQLLAATLNSVPAEMRITSLHLVREQVAPSTGASPPNAELTPDQAPVEESPLLTDLHTLQKECDSNQACILLEGTVASAADVQNYLRGVRESELVVAAEIQALETDAEGKTTFRARLRMRPGLGQNGGVALAAETTAPEVAAP